MKVRQLRKRKPRSSLAQLQALIHAQLLRAARRWPLRNDVVGRTHVAQAVERGWLTWIQQHGVPKSWRA